MQIGELATRTGVSVSRIRFYEGRGVLPMASRTGNGYRSYGEDAVAILNFVDQAQRLGFSLVEIREGMPDKGAATPAATTIITALRRKDAQIDQLIESAIAKKKAIAALLDELQCVGRSTVDSHATADPARVTSIESTRVKSAGLSRRD
ncbi:MAG: MerR family transcriptional regulator [Comamonadaceae bacterium]|nr:MAG: MerR family transcriptional regulator [Comamonadaceae bacterium]